MTLPNHRAGAARGALFLLWAALGAVGCARRSPSEDELSHPDVAAHASGTATDAAAAPSASAQTTVLETVNYRGVWGSAPDDVWAVGDRGTIAHFDGRVWSAVRSGTEENLTSVHGSAPDAIWAAGDKGSILRWDGKAWATANQIPESVLLSVWTSGPKDVWAVGTMGGEGGCVRHYDGTRWAQQMVPGSTSAWQITGSGPHDVWMVGSTERGTGLALRTLDGTKFDTVGYQGPSLRSIWVARPKEVWVLPYQGDVQRWDGAAWTPIPTPGKRMLHIDGTGPDDVWVVGNAGLVLHYAGGIFREEDVGTKDVVWTAWAGGKGKEAWVAGNGGLLRHHSGIMWTR